MPKETADDLLHTNEEYEKLKTKHGPDSEHTPRETPDGQGPGRSGYGKPEFDRWTIEEIREHATRLGIDDAETMARDALIDAVVARDTTRTRAGG